jgi:hypothetical protein
LHLPRTWTPRPLSRFRQHSLLSHLLTQKQQNKRINIPFSRRSPTTPNFQPCVHTLGSNVEHEYILQSTFMKRYKHTNIPKNYIYVFKKLKKTKTKKNIHSCPVKTVSTTCPWVWTARWVRTTLFLLLSM